jgi:hypothetical protein
MLSRPEETVAQRAAGVLTRLPAKPRHHWEDVPRWFRILFDRLMVKHGAALRSAPRRQTI